jgi:hypothetical protein
VGSRGLDGGQTRAHESLPRFGPPEGKDLCSAFPTLYYDCVYSEVLQCWRRLDLAVGGEHSRLRALGGDVNRV